MMTGPRETIRWSSAPFCVTATMPVIVSQLVDSVEIHDCSTLKIVQRILFDSPIIALSCIVKMEEREWEGEWDGDVDGDGDGYSSSNSSSNDRSSTHATSSANATGRLTGLNSNESVTHLQHVFVSTVGRSTDALYVLRMTPALQQVCWH